MDSPKVSKISIENFGGNSYVALKEDENTNYNLCIITQKVSTPLSGSKIMDSSTIDYSLEDDFMTKLYIVSISVLGLYVFYGLLSK